MSPWTWGPGSPRSTRNPYYDLEATIELSLQVPDAEGEVLAFPTIQTCEKGETAWTQVPTDGQDEDELESPAPGALTFSVGEPSASVSAPPEPETSSQVVEVVRDVVTAVSLAGLLLAAGLAIFLARVLPLSWEGTDTRRRLRRLLSYAAGVGAAGFVLQVPVAAVYGQGLELTDILSAFDAGSVVNELVSAGLVLLGLGMVVRGAKVTSPDPTDRALLLAGALLALAGPSLVGHTRAFAPAPVLVAWDVMHVTAGAIWLGGLVGLVLSLRALAGREVLAAQTLARFSTIAAFALVVVSAAGWFLAWRILGSWAGSSRRRMAGCCWRRSASPSSSPRSVAGTAGAPSPRCRRPPASVTASEPRRQ